MKIKNNKINFANFANGATILLLFVLSFSLICYSLETPDKYQSNDEWKKAREIELQSQIDDAVKRGATPSEISKIREKWVNENRAMESSRSQALRDFIKEVYGVSDDKTAQRILETDFEQSGTKPEQGQGRFGDIDMTPKPEAWKKICDYVNKNPDSNKFDVRGGSIEILNQETTIHNPNKFYKYSVEKGPDGKVKIVEPGKDGAPVRRFDVVAARAGDKESYISYEFDENGKIVIEDGASVGYDKNGNPVRKPGPKIADPHLNTLDNMKKIGNHFDKDKRGNFNYHDNQATAKAVMRTIEGAYGSDPSKWPPDIAEMHRKCYQVKNGVSLEELGMTDKNAKNKFYDQMQDVVKKSYEKTSADSARRDAELDAKRRQEWSEIVELKKKMGEMKKAGDEAGFKKAQSELQEKKSSYEKTSSKLMEKRSLELRAEHGVIENKGIRLLSDCKEGKSVRTVESKYGQVSVQDVETRKVMSPTELEAKLTDSTRKKLAESLKPEIPESSVGKGKTVGSGKVDIEPFSGRKALFDNTGKLLDLYGAYQNYDVTGEALDLVLDTNPTLKKGVQTITAGASLLTLAQNARTSAVGAIIAGAPGAIKSGAEASIDEYAKWYLENPGAGDPNFFQRTAIGFRGANNFAKQFAKDTVYGLTVKPVVDIYQIAESGTGAFNAKLAKIETERKNRENKEQMLATAEEKTFGIVRNKFDSMENDAKKILSDNSSTEDEKKKARAVLKELEFGRRRLQEAIDEQRNRDVSGEFGSNYDEEDENKRHVEHLKAVKEREEARKQRELTMKNLETALSNAEREMKSLTQIADSVKVSISVVDKETGSPLDAEVSISGAKYKNLRQECRNGSVVFKEVPSGNYDIYVMARGYESRRVSYSFDATKKKEYSGSFSLMKMPSDETQAFAKLAVMVVDSESGEAVSGATIALESPDRNYSYSASTPTGAMEFPTLASGDYFVSAGAPGYTAKSRLRIPIEPAKNPAPRCRITLVKLAKEEQKADGQIDFKNIFDNTYVQTDDGPKRAGELKKSGRNGTTDSGEKDEKPKTSNNNNDKIRKQIEALRAEGNAKLDKIRDELKKMEGQEIKMKCPICGYGGPHYWDGSGWSCKNCGATVCQPSNYPTSSGTYSKVRDDYKRRIAELEAKIK